jgi:hypothetical protein
MKSVKNAMMDVFPYGTNLRREEQTDWPGLAVRAYALRAIMGI